MRSGELRYPLRTAHRRLSWVAFGDAARPVVVCAHGLTRTGRDFDALGAALSDRFHVVCPDLPGRGRSEWLDGPDDYIPAIYVTALAALLAVVAAGRKVGWVGTSLGGILGMVMAAGPDQPIDRLVLNDIGPHIPAAGLARIAAYMAVAPAAFADLVALERHLRAAHAPFGALSNADWAQLTRTSARDLPDGRVALHYDPAIAAALAATPPGDVDLSAIWDRIAIPRLVIRGVESDILTAATAERMRADGAALAEVAGVGHAPALTDAATIARVRDFLSA